MVTVIAKATMMMVVAEVMNTVTAPEDGVCEPDCCVHVDVLVFVLVRMPISWLMWLVICWNMNSEKVRVEVESRSSSSSW